jgi:glycosyltransferase involved in cell wall biosynthesis
VKILWIDPVNSDPQFLNAMSLALAQAGHEVIVRSNHRQGYDPPNGISWSPFHVARVLPQSLENRPAWRLALAASYPLDWHRAVKFAAASGVKTVLISTNLALPRFDAWGLRSLRAAGILPLVIVHKPYRRFFERQDGSEAERYRSFYEQAARILVMTKYTQEKVQALYGFPESRFAVFPHPHFHDLLSGVPPALPLRDSLARWSEGHPVISFFSSNNTEHGLGTILDALPKIRARVPGVRTLIVTGVRNTTARRRIEQKANEDGSADTCHFRWTPYNYPELLAYLDATTVIIVPYDHATQSGVIALAAGFGIPVVATTVGGLPEMVVAGQTGELVPPREPQALAEAIARIVSAPALSEYRKHAHDFSRTVLCPARAASMVSECLQHASC